MGSNNSRTKRNKPKKPLVFAKDKKQAKIAMIVLFAFLINTVFLLVHYIQGQQPHVSKSSEQEAQTRREMLMGRRGKPGSLAQGATGTVVDNSSPQNTQQDANDIYSQTLDLQNNPNTGNQNSPVAQQSEVDIDILSQKPIIKRNGKTVEISVSNSGRQNPFLPSGDSALSGIYSDLMPPPETLPKNSDASKVISTTISGILYDKYCPSAIINFEGTDYLVKKGDVINNYRVLSISKTQVVVQLGKNVYSAGVGELLSQSALSGNVANLNKKFGGNDISINVRRKGY